MKVFLLNPPMLNGDSFMKEVGRCGRKTVAGELWPQTGLAYLAAVALENHCDVRLIDAMASRQTVQHLVHFVRNFGPHLVIANTTTPTFKNDAQVLTTLKMEHPAVFAFTGTHVSALPEESLKQSHADLIFINEAEGILYEVLQKWGKWEEIRGLAFRRNGEITRTSPFPYIENLDRLPFPARHLLPNDKYRMPFFENEPYATVIPTRGCPWRCTFCRAGKVWGRRIRTRSPENVISEIEHIQNDLDISNIVFMTDSLTLDKEWANFFFDALLHWHLKFRWICNSRVDAVNPEMLAKMKEAGCILISYGVESGSQKILDATRKKITLDDSRNAVKWTREAGILTMAYFIVGLPGETRETIEHTIQFARELDPDYVNFHVATPFPGTELYDLAKEQNWLVTHDWSQYEEEGSAVMRTEALSAEELVAHQRLAMRRFYLRPKIILREILRVRNLGQLRSKCRAAGAILSTLSRKKH